MAEANLQNSYAKTKRVEVDRKLRSSNTTAEDFTLKHQFQGISKVTFMVYDVCFQSYISTSNLWLIETLSNSIEIQSC